MAPAMANRANLGRGGLPPPARLPPSHWEILPLLGSILPSRGHSRPSTLARTLVLVCCSPWPSTWSSPVVRCGPRVVITCRSAWSAGGHRLLFGAVRGWSSPVVLCDPRVVIACRSAWPAGGHRLLFGAIRGWSSPVVRCDPRVVIACCSARPAGGHGLLFGEIRGWSFSAVWCHPRSPPPGVPHHIWQVRRPALPAWRSSTASQRPSSLPPNAASLFHQARGGRLLRWGVLHHAGSTAWGRLDAPTCSIPPVTAQRSTGLSHQK